MRSNIYKKNKTLNIPFSSSYPFGWASSLFSSSFLLSSPMLIWLGHWPNIWMVGPFPSSSPFFFFYSSSSLLVGLPIGPSCLVWPFSLYLFFFLSFIFSSLPVSLLLA
jgi:hypothetical protein